MITFLDLFSGIGGFRAGLEQVGFKCVGHVELDKHANNSYKAMFDVKEDEYFAEDIRAIRPEELPECDLWTAGFPCQDISIAGSQRGLEGRRSGLFFEIIRLLKGRTSANKPRWLLFENVKNLLSVNQGEDFTTVLMEISEVGYDIEWQLLNSKDFGVPQNRKRIYIVGYLRGRCASKIFSIGRSNGKNIEQLIGGKQGQRIYSIDGVSCTLTALGGGQGAKTGLYNVESNVQEMPIANRENNRHCILKNGKIRRLTPRECFRLQGFSDEMFDKVKLINSDSQLYKQAGNAVTVNVVKCIAEKIKNAEVQNG